MIDFKQIPPACYVLEESKLVKNLELMRYVQEQSGAQIICALKGFAMFSTFPIVRQYLPGSTASSLNEALLGLEEFGGEVHLCAPAYNPQDFQELLRCCDHITFNTLTQWEQFKAQVQVSPKKVSCAIRINPEYSEVENDLYNPCVAGTRLGITADKFGEKLPDGIEGLHFHTLCENNSDTLERTLAHVEQKFGHLLHQAKWLNMGGGHHITRSDYDVERLIRLIKHLRQTYDLAIYLEPGEAVGWQTGFLAAEVLDILDSRGVKVAVLNVSFTAHMPDCLEMPYKPRIRNAQDPLPQDKYVYRMGGMSCLAGDQMGDYAFEKPLSVGDRIIFEDMIHYTMVKTTTFNGVNLPSIGIIKPDNSFQLVKSFGYQDYRNRLS
ncbi:MAG: carboxynorspermidine decarboxylase [Cytophagales bacterium]|nr:MAG: carboxynorspermidine decarboxylase [Cytophagales bacterium]TAF60745.1 MAG: carboxynorspermidine decarboxylase [Cytophagales bacterium]